MAKDWTVKDSFWLGIAMCLPVAPIVIGVSAATGQWLWTILAVPAVVTVCVAGGLVAGLVRRSGAAVGAAKALGLLLAAAGGVALVVFGVMAVANASTCDPEVSRCVAVVNGVARGESTESVGSQQFGNVLLSLAFILPGLAILFFTIRAAVRTTRR